jgi:hypothetical protein
MSRVVDYLPVATETGANIEGQSAYEIEPIRLTGHQSGVAKSSVGNKMWRQSSVMVAALANLLSEALDVDILDDGDVDALKMKLQQVLMGGRTTILNADTPFYISATGSDSTTADGLSSTSAWATLQHAYDTVVDKIDLNGYAAIFNIGTGQNFAGVDMLTNPLGVVGRNSIQWKGAGIASTRINALNSNCFYSENGIEFLVSDVALTATGLDTEWNGYGIWCGASCVTIFDRIDYQHCDSAHMHATLAAIIATDAFKTHTYTISGGSKYHVVTDFSSMAHLYGATVSVTGNPAFTYFLYSFANGTTNVMSDTTFSGAATGTRFFVDRTSRINIVGRNESIIPGSIYGIVQPDGDANYFAGVRGA